MLKIVPDKRINALTIFIICFLLILVVDLLYLFSFAYLGILTSDSISQVNQCMSGVFVNHHPFWHTVFISLIIKIGLFLTNEITGAICFFSLCQIVFLSCCFALMHMGSLAVIGANNPKNLIHIIINNGAHETVGGMPTVAEHIDFVGLARACGYSYATSVNTYDDLDKELEIVVNKNELSLIEIKCSIGSRGNLERPTISTFDNKQSFMDHLKMLNY